MDLENSQFPVAFLLFDCDQCPTNYLNHARDSIVCGMEPFDPMIRHEDRQILSGDLFPGACKAIGRMIEAPAIDVDVSRLNPTTAAKLRSGEWPGDIYVAGIIFLRPEGVDLLHNNLRNTGVAAYLGTFTIPITYGTSDILDLAELLTLMEAPLMERL